MKISAMRLERCGDVLTRPQVIRLFQFPSQRALYRAVQSGKFPEPTITGPARWSRIVLLDWWTRHTHPPARFPSTPLRLT